KPTDSPTLTPTPFSSTPVPTWTATPPPSQTPTPTAAPPEYLDPETIVMDALEANEQHRWLFTNEFLTNHLTIQIASTNDLDIVIMVTDPSGTEIAAKNDSGAGQIEALFDLELTELGDYLITISGVDNTAGEYSIVALEDFSFSIIFDTISYNVPVDVTFSPDSERLYFFTGLENDLISITAVPDSRADIGIELIGPNAYFLEYIDRYQEGGTEQLIDYQLPTSGLYALWLFGYSNADITVNLLLSE
ncbi:MAG: hypothetical protein KC413_06190, partial [Anaerolineales bacterium]|nr:hypothetical protein [Anaerolineales bacterium]